MLDVATCSRSSVILSFFILYINPPPQSPSNYTVKIQGMKKQLKKPIKNRETKIWHFVPKIGMAYCEKKI